MLRKSQNIDDVNYGSMKRNTINPVSMKVFLDGEEDNFLSYKVEEMVRGDVILSLTLPTKVGYLKVGANSEADKTYQKWVCYLLRLDGM